MTDVPIDDLKSCLNCLVSVELQNEEVYQGRVEKIIEDLSTIVLTRPFKMGRPMTPPKYPLFVSPKDTITIIEEPLQSSTVPQTSKQSESSQQRSFTALELLEKAQAKIQNGNKQLVKANKQQKAQSSPPQNGYQLLQRPQKNNAQNNQLNGPCGNPIMDLLNGHIRRGKHEFDQPIDLQEINQDFDFCGNLALFQKKDSNSEDGYLDAEDQEGFNQCTPESGVNDSDYYRVVYEDKTAPNFRHDENIISDPKRVTSWINKSAPEFKPKLQTLQQQPTAVYKASAKKQNVKNVASTPSKSQKSLTSVEPSNDNNGTVDEYTSFELKTNMVLSTDNGAILPVLRKGDKQKLLAATTRLYNESMYNCIVADRFTEYVFDIHKRFSMTSKELVIIAGLSCDPITLHRFTQYFYNRDYKIHVYDPPKMPGLLENKVSVYRDVEKLPTDLPAIYLLCPQTFHSDEELRCWLFRMTRPPQTTSPPKTKIHYSRLIALDFRLFDGKFFELFLNNFLVKHMHTLYLGAADETVTYQGQMRQNSNESMCTFEAFVADCGTPYSWISCKDTTPSDAFRNSLLCRLNVT